MNCDCGQPLPDENALQCTACRRAALKKLLKLAATLGALLGLFCSQLPADYQAPCKGFASILASC